MRALIAIGLFLLVNALLWSGHYASEGDFALLEIEQPFCAVDLKTILQRPSWFFRLLVGQKERCVRAGRHLYSQENPELIMLGSSVMECPTWLLDREENPDIPFTPYYHKAKSFERALNRSSVMNLAAPVAMLSDQYFLVTRGLGDHKNLKTVVLGVFPRDFYDFDFQEPSKSVLLPYILSVSELFAERERLHLEWSDFADQLLKNNLFLYNRRQSIKYVLELKARRYFRINSDASETGSDPLYITYHHKYQGISIAKSQLQLGFLLLLSDFCRKQQIKLLLINMPLSNQHKATMPPLFYDEYCHNLESFAKREKIPYADLSHAKFCESDFSDGLHLNRDGALKWKGPIATFISEQLSKN